jgi:hypothetical protein
VTHGTIMKNDVICLSTGVGLAISGDNLSNVLECTKGVFTRTIKLCHFMSRIVARHQLEKNPIVVARCRATSGYMKFVFCVNSP